MLSDGNDVMLDETNENLKTMKGIYKSSNKFGQLVILSCASQHYSKIVSKQYFVPSLWVLVYETGGIFKCIFWATVH